MMHISYGLEDFTMEVLLSWDICPEKVIKSIELTVEFKQGESYDISRGIALQNQFDDEIFARQSQVAQGLLQGGRIERKYEI
jgi:hypothetical protein